MNDLFWAINKLKRIKAPGPDGIPVEFFKNMKKKQLELVLDLLNTWWNGADITEEVTKEKVILLYKNKEQTQLSELQANILTRLNLQHLHSNHTEKAFRCTRLTPTDYRIRI